MEVFVWIESPFNNVGRYLSTAIPASVFPFTCRHTEPDGRRSSIRSVSRTFCARPKSDFWPKACVRRKFGIFSKSLSVCCRINRSGGIKAMDWRCFIRRFQAFNARSSTQSIFSIGLFSNRWVLLGVGIAIILQIGAVQSPIGQMLFGTVGLTPGDWFLIIWVSSSIWVADELFKLIGIYGSPEKMAARG